MKGYVDRLLGSVTLDAAGLLVVSGESAAKEAGVLMAKWVARGLAQAVLQAIRTDVFNVAAPAAP